MAKWMAPNGPPSTGVTDDRKGLAGPVPKTIECMLAERCTVLYLADCESDLSIYRNMDVLSSKRADFNERRRDRANRRYLSSLKALALIQKMLAMADE